MDAHNVQHFWGISPALDFVSLQSGPFSKPYTLSTLQVCPADCRHTVASLTGLVKHKCAAAKEAVFHVFEDSAEGIARHALLVCALLENRGTSQRRAEMFLELHGNIKLHHDTVSLLGNSNLREILLARVPCALGDLAAKIEEVIVGSCHPQSGDQPHEWISSLFDFQHLTHRERDAVIEILRSYRSQERVEVDRMWDQRCRKYYKEHYDCRRNKIDWDYWMRLCTKDEETHIAQKSIIHLHQFASWRLNGMAYSFKDTSSPTEPNRTLLSSVHGRTKEFKNRYGADVGRSVLVKGYWGDIVNSPYHSFGTQSENNALFEKCNQDFKHSASDVALHNIQSFIEVLSRGIPPAKVVFLSGDLKKRIFASSRARFDIICVSCHATHILDSAFQLQRTAGKGSLLLCEQARNFLNLTTKQVKAFRGVVLNKVSQQGWKRADELKGDPSENQNPWITFFYDSRDHEKQEVLE